jgi:hypothetical protein
MCTYNVLGRGGTYSCLLQTYSISSKFQPPQEKNSSRWTDAHPWLVTNNIRYTAAMNFHSPIKQIWHMACDDAWEFGPVSLHLQIIHMGLDVRTLGEG